MPELRNAGNDVKLVSKMLAWHDFLSETVPDAGLSDLKVTLEKLAEVSRR